MIRVHLHGDLKDRFGGPFQFDAPTARQAIHGLAANFRDFRRAVIDGRFQVIRGDRHDGLCLGANELDFRTGQSDLHIVPVIEGAKRGGIGKVVLGVALVGVSFLAAPAVAGALGPTQGLGTTAFSVFGTGVTFGNIAALGVSLTLSGVAQAIAPTPGADHLGGARPDERPSFLFQGPVNVSSQGAAVPLIYGTMRTGSVIVSAGISTEDV